MKNIFSFKRIELSRALVFGTGVCLGFLVLFGFFVGLSTALPSAIEASALVLGIYGVVKARNQWVIDKGGEQLLLILQGMREFNDRFLEHSARLYGSGDFMSFKSAMADEFNKMRPLVSNASYLTLATKRDLYDLLFFPVKAKEVDNIKGYGDRLKEAIKDYDIFLSSEPYKTDTLMRDKGSFLSKINWKKLLRDTFFALLTGVCVAFFWSLYDEWRNTGQFLKQLEGEVNQNVGLARLFQEKSGGDASLKYLPFYPSQYRTLVRDVVLPAYESHLEAGTLQKVNQLYSEIDMIKEALPLIWSAGASGQTQAGEGLTKGAHDRQDKVIVIGKEVLSAIQVEEEKISYLCIFEKCLVHP